MRFFHESGRITGVWHMRPAFTTTWKRAACGALVFLQGSSWWLVVLRAFTLGSYGGRNRSAIVPRATLVFWVRHRLFLTLAFQHSTSPWPYPPLLYRLLSRDFNGFPPFCFAEWSIRPLARLFCFESLRTLIYVKIQITAYPLYVKKIAVGPLF